MIYMGGKMCRGGVHAGGKNKTNKKNKNTHKYRQQCPHRHGMGCVGDQDGARHGGGQDRWDEGMGDGDTNRTGMSVSMLAAVCVPVGLGGMFSLGLLSLAKRYSLPEQAPIPCSSSQSVLISTLLGLHTVLITIYIVYQWHCTYRPTHTQNKHIHTFVCIGLW